MKDIRSRVVAGVAATCIIPLLFTMYLMTCWYTEELQSSSVIVVLTIMAVLILFGGVAILKSIPAGAGTGCCGGAPASDAPKG